MADQTVDEGDANAEHQVALVGLDQVIVEAFPLATDVGEAVRVKAGAGLLQAAVAEQVPPHPSEPPPAYPHAVGHEGVQPHVAVAEQVPPQPFKPPPAYPQVVGHEGVQVDVLFAEQLAVEPPPEPVHDQLHGPEPETLEAEPALQRFVVGAEATVVPLAEPQEPFTTVAVAVAVFDAEQLAVEPPPEPVHDQLHGPEPETLEAEPALQSPEVGADETVVPLAEPQEPFTAAAGQVTVVSVCDDHPPLFKA